jgi:hypothetical protein
VYIEVSSECPSQEGDGREEDVKARHTDSWVSTNVLQFEASVDNSSKQSVIAVGRVLGNRVCKAIPYRYVSRLGRCIDQ